jgi:HAD superfamily hydrolase (TIGR01509 family)
MSAHPYKAVIFDMDGVLIDSEPYWRRAQIECLQRYHVQITERDCIEQTMGHRIDAIGAIWCRRHRLDVPSETLARQILQQVTAEIETQGSALPGVYRTLQLLRQRCYQIALATSSSHSFIQVVLNRLNLNGFFDQICSADDETYGKPHPAVYLKTATLLGVPPEGCVVIEDSVTGMIAAKAASMTTYIVSRQHDCKYFAIADRHFPSLEILSDQLLDDAIGL